MLDMSLLHLDHVQGLENVFIDHIDWSKYKKRFDHAKQVFFLIKTCIKFYHYMLFSKKLSLCILHEILFINIQHQSLQCISL